MRPPTGPAWPTQNSANSPNPPAVRGVQPGLATLGTSTSSTVGYALPGAAASWRFGSPRTTVHRAATPEVTLLASGARRSTTIRPKGARGRECSSRARFAKTELPGEGGTAHNRAGHLDGSMKATVRARVHPSTFPRTRPGEIMSRNPYLVGSAFPALVSLAFSSATADSDSPGQPSASGTPRIRRTNPENFDRCGQARRRRARWPRAPRERVVRPHEAARPRSPRRLSASFSPRASPR